MMFRDLSINKLFILHADQFNWEFLRRNIEWDTSSCVGNSSSPNTQGPPSLPINIYYDPTYYGHHKLPELDLILPQGTNNNGMAPVSSSAPAPALLPITSPAPKPIYRPVSIVLPMPRNNDFDENNSSDDDETTQTADEIGENDGEDEDDDDDDRAYHSIVDENDDNDNRDAVERREMVILIAEFITYMNRQLDKNS